MRIWESCVSSEDIKHETGADSLFSYMQGGISCMIVKDNEWIGFIDHYALYLGDDILIKSIKIYNNEKLSEELTEKYMGKILISSHHKDQIN